MTPPSNTDEELRRLAEAATKGEWHVEGTTVWMPDVEYGMEPDCCGCFNRDGSCCGNAVPRQTEEWVQREIANADGADATFIAAANPSRVLGLLDRIKELEEENRKLACADMIWNMDDPERPYESIEELISEICDGETVERSYVDIQRAVSLPSQFITFNYKYDPETGDETLVYDTLHTEQVQACRAVGQFARKSVEKELRFAKALAKWPRNWFRRELDAADRFVRFARMVHVTIEIEKAKAALDARMEDKNAVWPRYRR